MFNYRINSFFVLFFFVFCSTHLKIWIWNGHLGASLSGIPDDDNRGDTGSLGNIYYYSRFTAKTKHMIHPWPWLLFPSNLMAKDDKKVSLCFVKSTQSLFLLQTDIYDICKNEICTLTNHNNFQYDMPTFRIKRVKCNKMLKMWWKWYQMCWLTSTKPRVLLISQLVFIINIRIK